MTKPLPNRIALYLTAAAALLGALVPIVADLDIESVAGIAAGLAAISAVVYKWLDGWSKYERGEGVGLLPGEPDDRFDEAGAGIPTETAEAAHAEIPKATPS